MSPQIRQRLKRALPNTLITQKLNSNCKTALLLSFDDGPHEKITRQILELLDIFSAKAIFFVAGFNAQKSPHVIKDILNRGHIIGNHTFSHLDARRSTLKDYQSDIAQCQMLVQSITGKTPALFRPPYGVLSLKSVFSAYSLGLKIVLWTVDSGDWSFNISAPPSKIANDIVSTVKPNQIVLMHDNNPKIPKVLAEILPVLKSANIDLQKGIEYFYPSKGN